MALPYEFVPQIGSAGRIGLIVLKSDETIEAEMREVLPAGDVALFTTRISSDAEVSTETLARMEMDIPRAAGLFPESVKFDVVGYGCTSASSVIGSDRVAELVQDGCATPEVTNPLRGLIRACEKLGVSKLGLLTPYAEEVSDSLRAALSRAGIDTPVFGSFNEPLEANVTRIDPASVKDAATALGRDAGCEAVFMSCTNLRTFSVLDSVEAAAGKPALSSNQVLFWDMFRLAGMKPARGVGTLLHR